MAQTVYQIECKTPRHCYIGITAHFEHRIRRHAREAAKTQPSYDYGPRIFLYKHGFRTHKALCVVETRMEAERVEFVYQQVLKQRGFVVGGIPWWHQPNPSWRPSFTEALRQRSICGCGKIGLYRKAGTTQTWCRKCWKARAA